MKEISVFFAYSFKSQNSYYGRSEIVAVIEEACELASGEISNSGNKTKIKPDFYLNEFGESLLVEIEKRVIKCRICIIDISDNNPNVFFELGLAKASLHQIILIKNKSSLSDFNIPSDINGLHLLFYDNINEITGRLSQRIVGAAGNKLHSTEQIPTKDFGSYYTPLSTQFKQIESSIPEVEAELDFIKIQQLNGDHILENAESLYERWPKLEHESKRRIIEELTESIFGVPFFVEYCRAS